IAFIVAAVVTNYIAGNFATGGLLESPHGDIVYHWGFTQQPIALPYVDEAGATVWSQYIWTFLGFVLVGLAATQLGGCPLRNITLSGEGDADAGVTVLGYIAGGALAHNFLLSSSPGGLGTWGPVAVVVGLVFCVVVGLFMRDKAW
ncbi:hypothetical protein ACFLTL_01640, partial [Chloroflexota bacterium]